jgi:hypothetical protein
MATEDPRKGGKWDVDPDIAAAEWILNDSIAEKPLRDGSGDLARRTPESSDTFALADQHSSDNLTTFAPPPRTEWESQTARPRRSDAPESQSRMRLEPSALVEETWSRRGEWGMTALQLAVWLIFVVGTVYWLLGEEAYGTAFCALMGGGLVALVLFYPILITLERPVRVTPEQAVRDYYGALSHHVPHYRRMWLLLSTAGRISGSYASYDGFKSYWRDRLRALRGNHASFWTPLVFEVVNFKAEKSAGKTVIEAEFTIKVSVRGHRVEGPIQTIPVQIELVRGPDRMWYLENGTLPRERMRATANAAVAPE